jgi:hypothetical protein
VRIHGAAAFMQRSRPRTWAASPQQKRVDRRIQSPITRPNVAAVVWFHISRSCGAVVCLRSGHDRHGTATASRSATVRIEDKKETAHTERRSGRSQFLSSERRPSVRSVGVTGCWLNEATSHWFERQRPVSGTMTPCC